MLLLTRLLTTPTKLQRGGWGSLNLSLTPSLVGQAAGELYSYTIGGYGPPRMFRAAPRRRPDAEFSFIVYGDMGESKHRVAKSPGYRSPGFGYFYVDATR